MTKVICPRCNKNVEKKEYCELCESRLILNDRYHLLEISKGIGVKYIAEDENHNKFIIKALPIENIDNWADKENFQREINILKQLNHKQIPKFIESFEFDNIIYMVREYIDGITISEEFETRRYTENEILDLLLEIASIIDYLHNLIPPIIYGNFKLENIIRGSKGIYITDFSLSGDLDKISEIIPYYDVLAPEQVTGNFVLESDFYFLGLMILKLITRKEFNSLKDTSGDFDIEGNTSVTENTTKILENILNKDYKKRIKSYDELLLLCRRQGNKPSVNQNDILVTVKNIKFNNRVILIPIILILLILGGFFSFILTSSTNHNIILHKKLNKVFNKKSNDRFYSIAKDYYDRGQFLSSKINFETSCNQHKNANSCYEVALMYEVGKKMVRKNNNKAKEYYKKACKLGISSVCKK